MSQGPLHDVGIQLIVPPTSSFVTTDLALLRAKEASLGIVGAFSTGLLDEGALGISQPQPTEPEPEPGLEGTVLEVGKEEDFSHPPPSRKTGPSSTSFPS